MAQYKAFNTQVEVNGETILSVVKGMVAQDMAVKILADNKINNPKPGNWYSQQNWLNAFRNIGEKISSLALLEIGKKIPDNAQWPPQIKTIDQALSSIDVAYHLNHRLNGRIMFDPATGNMQEGIGHYGYEKTGSKTAKMVCNNPYPCEFDRGIIQSVALKFKPEGSRPVVLHDDTKPCRKKGADSCTYNISW
ncbi:MAG: hypothetical protein V1859_03755 [archaeon]